MSAETQAEAWPPLHLADWQDTCETRHRWTQVLGKVRLALTPSLNQTWHSALYLTARGLTTSPVPSGQDTFELRLDFWDHRLTLETSAGGRRSLALVPMTVADFYGEVMALLRAEDIRVHLWPVPVEIADPIPLDSDQVHRSYDAPAVERFFRALTQADQAFKAFMGRFQGKQSPSHFFWGSFDLAQTRFSGRSAPLKPGADWLTRECYDQEVMSFGFWPGTAGVCDASFYAYAVPQPMGFEHTRPRPHAAHYDPALKEFLLPYDDVRQAPQPRAALLDFCQSVYDAGALLGGWDRAALDRTATLPRASHPISQPESVEELSPAPS